MPDGALDGSSLSPRPPGAKTDLPSDPVFSHEGSAGGTRPRRGRHWGPAQPSAKPQEAQSVSPGRGLPETHTEAAWVQVPRMTAVTAMSPVKPGGQVGGAGMVGDNTEHRVRKSTGALGAPGRSRGLQRGGHPTRCIPSAYPGQGFPRQPGGPPEADRLPAPLGVSASPLVAVPSRALSCPKTAGSSGCGGRGGSFGLIRI